MPDDTPSGGPSPAPVPDLVPRRIRIEKNLNSLGLFTATHHNDAAENGVMSRVIELGSRDIDGKRTQQRVEIVGYGRWGGLPSGADRDKYYAFMKIVDEQRKVVGRIENPVTFTSYELLSILSIKPGGAHYQKVDSWLDRMMNTTIMSEYAVFFKGRKKWAKDSFHVFDRVVRTGQQLDDGSAAQSNHVWLSSWQLENLNASYVFPVNLGDYLSLRNDLARALLAHLVQWFFATHGAPFEKRYDHLCALLGIRTRRNGALIRQQFRPSMEELINAGYLRSWEVAPILGNSPPLYKLVLVPGTRYESRAQPALLLHAEGPEIGDSENPAAQLVARSVRPDIALQIIAQMAPGQDVAAQVAYFDSLQAQMGRKMTNPPGFLVEMIRRNTPVPEEFQAWQEPAQQATTLPSPDEIAERDRHLKETALRNSYQDFCDKLARNYSADHTQEAAGIRLAVQRQLRKEQPELLSQGQGFFDAEVDRRVTEKILTVAKVPLFAEWRHESAQAKLF
jgi:hypothetical protein